MFAFKREKTIKKNVKRTSSRSRRNEGLFCNKKKIVFSVETAEISLDKMYKEIVMLKNEFWNVCSHTTIESPSHMYCLLSTRKNRFYQRTRPSLCIVFGAIPTHTWLNEIGRVLFGGELGDFVIFSGVIRGDVGQLGFSSCRGHSTKKKNRDTVLRQNGTHEILSDVRKIRN